MTKLDIQQIREGLSSLVVRNNELCEMIREIDTEHILDVSMICMDFSDLQFSFEKDSLVVMYEHYSFGEDFSQSWAIPYELLELSDDDVPEYVARKIAQNQKEWDEYRQAEIDRLKREIEILEENV